MAYVLPGHFLAVSSGSDAVFYPLLFLHIVSALAGFGSIGFAGTYASRAANLAAAAEGDRPPSNRPPSNRRPSEAGLLEADSGGGAEEGPSLAAAAGIREGSGPAGVRGGSGRLASEGLAGGEGTASEGLAGGEGTASEGLAGGEGTASEGTAGRAVADAGSVDPEVEEVVRYFRRPARFWKAVLAVPLFGVLALLAEPGGGGLDQVWDLTALLVWGGAAVVAAGVVAPSLRHMSTVLLSPGPPWHASAAHRARLSRYGRLASRGAAACDVLFFVALALMIWRP